MDAVTRGAKLGHHSSSSSSISNPRSIPDHPVDSSTDFILLVEDRLNKLAKKPESPYPSNRAPFSFPNGETFTPRLTSQKRNKPKKIFHGHNLPPTNRPNNVLRLNSIRLDIQSHLPRSSSMVLLPLLRSFGDIPGPHPASGLTTSLSKHSFLTRSPSMNNVRTKKKDLAAFIRTMKTDTPTNIDIGALQSSSHVPQPRLNSLTNNRYQKGSNNIVVLELMLKSPDLTAESSNFRTLSIGNNSSHSTKVGSDNTPSSNPSSVSNYNVNRSDSNTPETSVSASDLATEPVVKSEILAGTALKDLPEESKMNSFSPSRTESATLSVVSSRSSSFASADEYPSSERLDFETKPQAQGTASEQSSADDDVSTSDADSVSDHPKLLESPPVNAQLDELVGLSQAEQAAGHELTLIAGNSSDSVDHSIIDASSNLSLKVNSSKSSINPPENSSEDNSKNTIEINAGVETPSTLSFVDTTSSPASKVSMKTATNETEGELSQGGQPDETTEEVTRQSARSFKPAKDTESLPSPTVSKENTLHEAPLSPDLEEKLQRAALECELLSQHVGARLSKSQNRDSEVLNGEMPHAHEQTTASDLYELKQPSSSLTERRNPGLSLPLPTMQHKFVPPSGAGTPRSTDTLPSLLKTEESEFKSPIPHSAHSDHENSPSSRVSMYSTQQLQKFFDDDQKEVPPRGDILAMEAHKRYSATSSFGSALPSPKAFQLKAFPESPDNSESILKNRLSLLGVVNVDFDKSLPASPAIENVKDKWNLSALSVESPSRESLQIKSEPKASPKKEQNEKGKSGFRKMFKIFSSKSSAKLTKSSSASSSSLYAEAHSKKKFLSSFKLTSKLSPTYNVNDDKNPMDIKMTKPDDEAALPVEKPSYDLPALEFEDIFFKDVLVKFDEVEQQAQSEVDRLKRNKSINNLFLKDDELSKDQIANQQQKDAGYSDDFLPLDAGKRPDLGGSGRPSYASYSEELIAELPIGSEKSLVLSKEEIGSILANPGSLTYQFLRSLRQYADLNEVTVKLTGFDPLNDTQVDTSGPKAPILSHKKNYRARKSVKFANVIHISETFDPDMYKRYNRSVTHYYLTEFAEVNRIKNELNYYKCHEMLVHQKSQCNTHFFY
ncbi:hypothetical protein PUMCH_002598 [Australozyma saopauloensis]|uniref:Uncharacterized protein n=1 Tax=Australozyma saopauloensis TaxID=291208 RepID=A0AAX4HBL9_9ASCO|nr:hypothetical protein PUMCH_002598 [[Candida] saopauloensis]